MPSCSLGETHDDDGASAKAVPGSNLSVMSVISRILDLVVGKQVISVLPAMDADQLLHRANEAVETLKVSAPDNQERSPPLECATPCLCALATECIKVVETSDLITPLARVVAGGCEVLAELLDPASKEYRAAWSMDWLAETLEDLSDVVDFMALEVYCGLGRSEPYLSEAPDMESDDLHGDDFGKFFGCIEHRQALQELCVWLLCLVFRSVGYENCTARVLMAFANHDVYCLCTLLRGLLSVRPRVDTGLPEDVHILQGLAVQVLCGLTAPELAFPAMSTSCMEELDLDSNMDGEGGDSPVVMGESIQEKNRTLAMFLEVLCAALVDTDILSEDCLRSIVALAKVDGVDVNNNLLGPIVASRLLSLLGALALQADGADQESDHLADAPHPALKLRAVVEQQAEVLSTLVEAALAPESECNSSHCLRDLLIGCARLTGSLHRSTSRRMSGPVGDDDFTLACSNMVRSFAEFGLHPIEAAHRASALAALIATAANIDLLEAYRNSFAVIAGTLTEGEAKRCMSQLRRRDAHRLLIVGGPEAATSIFLQSQAGIGIAAEEAPSQGAVAIAAALGSQSQTQQPDAAPEEASSDVAGAAAAAPAAGTAGSNVTRLAAEGGGGGGGGGGAFRDMLTTAPMELRCPLDGKLLCDPVVTPGGHIFERSNLIRALAENGGRCPLSGEPLDLMHCSRSAAVRKQVTEWARSVHVKKGKR